MVVFPTRMTLKSICAFVAAVQCIACTSTRIAPEKVKAVEASARSAQANGKDAAEQASYEVKSSFSVRLKELLSQGDEAAPGALSPVLSRSVNAESRSQSSNSVVSGVPLFVRSQRWADILNETHDAWQNCSTSSGPSSETCRQIAHARILSFAKLKDLRASLGVYDALSQRSVNSTDALLVAGVFADFGASRLCAQLAHQGLQWVPADVHTELRALESKCLRLDARPDDAREALRIALVESPNAELLQIESALLALSEKNLTQGCDLLERLYAKENQQVAVLYNWGHCLVQRKDSAQATLVLAKARSVLPSERAWLLLGGEIARLEGRMEDARRNGLDYLAAAEASDPLRVQAERLVREADGE
ncbi:hypothetical protein EBU99_00690 [bacterium]|nr:hypothetical protein [bacterium]